MDKVIKSVEDPAHNLDFFKMLKLRHNFIKDLSKMTSW